MKLKNIIGFGIYCIFMQSMHVSIHAAAPAVAATPVVTTPVVTTTPDVNTATAKSPVVTTDRAIKRKSTLTSIHIQNTFNTDAILNEIEIVISSQKDSLIKKDLKIKIPGKKSIYDKGSMISFNIAADNKDYGMFNGIKSITINNDQIIFDTLKTAFKNNPIKITYQDNKWIEDTSK